jgi:hypothetical protein
MAVKSNCIAAVDSLTCLQWKQNWAADLIRGHLQNVAVKMLLMCCAQRQREAPDDRSE